MELDKQLKEILDLRVAHSRLPILKGNQISDASKVSTLVALALGHDFKWLHFAPSKEANAPELAEERPDVLPQLNGPYVSHGYAHACLIPMKSIRVQELQNLPEVSEDRKVFDGRIPASMVQFDALQDQEIWLPILSSMSMFAAERLPDTEKHFRLTVRKFLEVHYRGMDFLKVDYFFDGTSMASVVCQAVLKMDFLGKLRQWEHPMFHKEKK